MPATPCHLFGNRRTFLKSAMAGVGCGSCTSLGKLLTEEDVGKRVRTAPAKRGIVRDVVDPWNWHHGSFEGIFMASDGTAHACSDPRRKAMALAV